MSKFKGGKVYIIKNDADITQQMINYSTSTCKSAMPTKTVSGVVKRLIEVSEPVDDVFAQDTWYDIDTIAAAWDALGE